MDSDENTYKNKGLDGHDSSARSATNCRDMCDNNKTEKNEMLLQGGWSRFDTVWFYYSFLFGSVYYDLSCIISYGHAGCQISPVSEGQIDLGPDVLVSMQ